MGPLGGCISTPMCQRGGLTNAVEISTWLRAVEVSWREALRRAATTATTTAISIWLLPGSTVVALLWLRH
jgi:hypothetical protein